MDLRLMKLRMLKRVFFPPEVCVGKDSLERLSCLEASRVLLVISGSAAAGGLQDKCLAKLKDIPAKEALVWTSGEPTAASISAAREQVEGFAPDWIVAVGGGSVLDAAKFLWAQYEHPALDWSGAAAAIPALRTKARLMLIPTTAGSGSEASQAAVLTNAAGLKTPYVSRDWVPDIVVLDPVLTLGLSREIIVSTGFDALSHAVEAAVSSFSHGTVRALSATAIRGVFTHLPRLLDNPADLAAREGMLNASHLAGVCQSTASTGAAHALAHAMAAFHHVPHGVLTGSFLAPTMEWNRAKNAALYDELAAAAGFADGAALIAAIRELAAAAGVPSTLSQLAGGPLTAEQVTAIAAGASKDVCLRSNPGRMTAADLHTLLEGLG